MRIKVFYRRIYFYPFNIVFRQLYFWEVLFLWTSFESPLWNCDKSGNYMRTDNSAKDNSANLKFRQFSQKYTDNSASFTKREIRKKKIGIGDISRFEAASGRSTRASPLGGGNRL